MPPKLSTFSKATNPCTLDVLLSTVPAMRQMPRREIKLLKRKHYSLCLEQLPVALDDDEKVETLTCALSSSRGRGVLALTDRRLVLITLRTGTCDWALSEIDSVRGRGRGRAAYFMSPAAIYLDTPTGTIVIALGDGPVVVTGDGPVWGPMFTEATRRAHARQPLALAA